MKAFGVPSAAVLVLGGGYGYGVACERAGW